MRSDILERVAADLLSIPPLIFRVIRRKLIKITISDIDMDITPLHFEIMRELEESGPTHVAIIGEKLQIAKAQMTQLIDKLAELNIVKRETNTGDRRTINISLTEHGSTIWEKHNKILMEVIRENMSRLSDTELEDLSNCLRKVRDILFKLE